MGKRQEPRWLWAIAVEIRRHWDENQMPHEAKLYLSAMLCLDKVSDAFGQETGASIVTEFLANARKWQGSNARRIKHELRSMLKRKDGSNAR